MILLDIPLCFETFRSQCRCHFQHGCHLVFLKPTASHFGLHTFFKVLTISLFTFFENMTFVWSIYMIFFSENVCLWPFKNCILPNLAFLLTDLAALMCSKTKKRCIGEKEEKREMNFKANQHNLNRQPTFFPKSSGKLFFYYSGCLM